MRKATKRSESVRAALLSSALAAFNARGFDKVTIADICSATGLSNGSFFHQFPSKECLAAEIYLEALRHYHRNLGRALTGAHSAEEGIAALIRVHLRWVERNRQRARFLFAHTRTEWLVSLRTAQEEENAFFLRAIDNWRTKQMSSGQIHEMPVAVFISQIIGPAQIICRAWLSGRRNTPPSQFAGDLIGCGIRALCMNG
jgi:AcrR family transcriptional regulator